MPSTTGTKPPSAGKKEASSTTVISVSVRKGQGYETNPGKSVRSYFAFRLWRNKIIGLHLAARI